jgi:hypothetical protein
MSEKPWSGPQDGPPPWMCSPSENAKRAANLLLRNNNPPKAVSPVVQSGDDANAKPIPAAAFEVERFHQRGGSSGFSVNGYLLGGRKPG